QYTSPTFCESNCWVAVAPSARPRAVLLACRTASRNAGRVAAPARGRRGTLIDRVLEALAGLEADDAALRHLHAGARLRVAGGPRLSHRRLERAETDEGDGMALLQRSGDAVEQRLDRAHRADFREPRVLDDLGDEFLLVHRTPPDARHARAAGRRATAVRDALHAPPRGYTLAFSRSQAHDARSPRVPRRSVTPPFSRGPARGPSRGSDRWSVPGRRTRAPAARRRSSASGRCRGCASPRGRDSAHRSC